MAGISGDLSVMTLADLIIWLANRSKTGTLVVESEYVKKEITLEAGAAVRASSNNPREYLGQFLVNFGLITDEQLQRAFEVQLETKVLLGRILVMIGIVAEDQVVKTLEYKVRESVLDALRFSQGRFTFEDRELSSDRPEIEVSVPLLEIHREAAARAPLWEAYLKVFPKPTLALAVVESRVPMHMPISTFDGRILNLARAGFTVEAIIADLRAMDFQVYSRLFELHRLGAIETYEQAPRPRSSRPAGGNGGMREQPVLLQDVVGPDEEVTIESIPPIPGATPQIAFSPEAVPVLLQPLDEVLKKRASSRERYLLTRIDGHRNIGAILQVVPMRDQEALQILKSLASAGLIRY